MIVVELKLPWVYILFFWKLINDIILIVYTPKMFIRFGQALRNDIVEKY